jgi:hypothetical protein
MRGGAGGTGKIMVSNLDPSLIQDNDIKVHRTDCEARCTPRDTRQCGG